MLDLESGYWLLKVSKLEERKMKKVAIITLFDYTNIGNKLQNYAVQTLISDLGYIPETLLCENLFYRESGIERLKVVLGRFIKKYKQLSMDSERKKVFKDSTKNLIRATPIYTWNEIQNLNEYDAYVTGSDQVWYNWLHKEGELEFRFLSFAERKKIICFSPSFGMDCIDDLDKDFYKKALKRFYRFSCREESGCEIIKNLTGREAILLNDPTMMLELKRWKEISRKPSYDIPDRYILVYCLSGVSPKAIDAIKDFARENICEVIDIYNIDYLQYYNTTPQEFLFLLDKAQYVFTNSFHGTVFSILFNKKFTCYLRESKNARMNSRVLTLLNKTGLLDRKNKISNQSIDYTKVNEIIKQERKKGIEYLSSELKRAAES